MSEALEVIFTCDNNENQHTCAAWDFRTGTNLMTYKGGGYAQRHSLCLLRSEYLISANSTKPLIHVWPINSQEQVSSVRFVTPGKVDCLALCPDGNYLTAGIQETLYIWHLSTGRMLNTLSKHYQTINCIKFTDDGSHFVSAGQDGSVLVWNLTQVVSRADDSQTTLYNFNDHGLPVTDVHVGSGGIRAYLITVSLDRTCKIYDLNCGTMLLNVVFGESLQCVVSNALETSVFVGTTEGNIYEFHTNALPRSKEFHIDKEHSNKFKGHQGIVMCLALSLDGQTLVSGGQDNRVCIWHILSKQLIKSLPHKGSIGNIELKLTCATIFNPEQKQPLVFMNNLKRMIDAPEADDEEIIEVFVAEQDDDYETDNSKINEVSNYTLNRLTTIASNVESNDSTEEISQLRAEIKKLKSINKNLFELSAKNMLKNKK